MAWSELAVTALTSAGLAAVLVKLLNRRVDNARADQIRAQAHADAEKVRAEAKEIATSAVIAESEVLRQVIADVREDAAEDRGKAKAIIAKLEERLEKLEERERHMLTRAAVHEAWDQLAFAFIQGHDASFPTPPPLRPPAPQAITASEEPDDN